MNNNKCTQHMILYDSQMKHSDNIDDDSEQTQLKVPLFPGRKKPSNEIYKQSVCSSQSTKITEYRNTSNSLKKRELEIAIVDSLAKEATQHKYLISEAWIHRYKAYLYDQGPHPGPINNSDLKDHIIANEALWRFLHTEYQGGPEVVQTLIKDRRSRTIEPVMMSRASQQSAQIRFYEMPSVGMKNESYFCYLHAGLQCLLSLYDFNYFLMRIIRQICKIAHGNKKIMGAISFCRAYLELVESIQASKEPVKVRALKHLIMKKFHPKNQHDCHEMMLYLLGQLEDEINQVNKLVPNCRDSKGKPAVYVNFVETLFKGVLQSCVTCLQCRAVTIVQEPFLTLSLAIHLSKTVEQCLEEYFKEERLKDFKCSKCGGACVKQNRLTQLPNILILHLKRFQYFPQCHKNNKPIQYPLEVLPLLNQTYRLRSVIIHTGNLQQGHYYCYCKRFHQWFSFNDEQVGLVSKREVLNQQAYILFYQLNRAEL